MSKVTWPKHVVRQLRLPGVCAVTGQPATTPVRFIFQSPWARYIGGSIYAFPPRMDIPLSAAPAAKVRQLRYLTFGGPGAAVLGAILIVALRHGVFLPILGALLVVAGRVLFIVGRTLVSNVIGAGAKGQWIYMNKAHPAFVDALVRMNPPGMVQVLDAAPQQQDGT